jgi:predicted RNase H-like nuclease (RuvC/YqgF family)
MSEMPTFKITESVSIDVEFEVYCAECGDGLCNQSRTDNTQRRGEPFVSVEPCKKCLDKARENSYDEGHDSQDNEISELRSEVGELRAEISRLEGEVSGLRDEI